MVKATRFLISSSAPYTRATSLNISHLGISKAVRLKYRLYDICLNAQSMLLKGDMEMPEFTNPFIGNVPRKITKEELIRAIRLNIAAEHEATHIYMAHADATDDPLAKKVLIDIANEERVHAGEFQRLLKYLDPDEEQFYADGAREVEEMKAELDGTAIDVEIDTAGDPIDPPEEPREGPEESEADGEEQAAVDVETESMQVTAGIKTIGSLFSKS